MATTTSIQSGHWRITLLWILLTAVIWGTFSAPILLNQVEFPFWLTHSVFILVFMGCIRYLFFLRHSWLVRQQYLKVAIVFLAIWGVFYLVDSLHDFQVFTDEDGLETFLGHLPNADYTRLRNFIKSEMIFFGTGSIIALAILAIRMIISVWRWHNLKKA